MVSETLNARLIDAVEAGRLDLVLQLLEGGASANAQKKITLFARCVKQRISFRGDAYEIRRDQLEAESALGLAVVHGRVDIVKALLDAGADPNQQIHRHGFIFFHRMPVNNASWDARRDNREPFESALHLALQHDPQAPFNPPGGIVNLSSPITATAVRRYIDLTPNIDVVSALLEHEAQVTNTCIAQARKLQANSSMPEFPALLSGQVRADSSSVHSAASGERTTPQLVRIVTELRRENRELKATLAKLAERNEELQKAVLERTAAAAAAAAAAPTPVSGMGGANGTAGAAVGTDMKLACRDVKRLFHVVGSFDPQRDDEIALRPGEQVFCSIEYADGWGEGTNISTNQSGHFPVSFTAPTAPTGQLYSQQSHSIPSRTFSLGMPAPAPALPKSPSTAPFLLNLTPSPPPSIRDSLASDAASLASMQYGGGGGMLSPTMSMPDLGRRHSAVSTASSVFGFVRTPQRASTGVSVDQLVIGGVGGRLSTRW